MFAKFFIDRPRFAMVISILIALAGVIAAFSLPVAQYPNVTPPQIQVSTTYRAKENLGTEPKMYRIPKGRIRS